MVLRAKPAAILFEASNPRHAHEWLVWQDAALPRGQDPHSRAADLDVELRGASGAHCAALEQFANIVGRERVIAGTDCGFGTFAGVGKMDADIS